MSGRKSRKRGNGVRRAGNGRGGILSSKGNRYQQSFEGFRGANSNSSSNTPRQMENRNKLGYRQLLEIAKKEPNTAATELNGAISQFISLVSDTNIQPDVMLLSVQIIGGKVCSSDLNLTAIRNNILAKLCTVDFLKKLKDVTYSLIEGDLCEEQCTSATTRDEELDKSPAKVLAHLLSFYDVLRNTMPTLATDLLPGNIKAAKFASKHLRETTDVSEIQEIETYMDLDSRCSELEKWLTEIKSLENPPAKTRNQNFQSRPTQKGGFSKGEIERWYLEDPPEDFRKLTVAPTKEELRSQEAPFLRPCIPTGSYPSSDVYLDVQFRLLREDFVAPLREGIQYYLKNSQQNVKRVDRMPFGTVRIYKNVRMVRVKLDGDMTVYSLNFSTEPFRKINWDKSKRLLTGSLLCLTSDNFQTLYLATVVFRRLEDLKNGTIDVVWEGPKPDIGQQTAYLMMESEVYYEAYRHTLSTLQNMKLDDYPMKKYIVDANVGEVPPPSYLLNTLEPPVLRFNALYKKDASPVVDVDVVDEENEIDDVDEENEKEDVDEENQKDDVDEEKVVYVGVDGSMIIKVMKRKKRKEIPIPPLEIKSWPTAEELGMDDSQYAAFQYSVTKELCVIQGPPGTGKTYIGLQIAKLFLANPMIYETGCPILIVCYTNHALDQFLEGIVDIMKTLNINTEDRLIRIGSRSTVESLKDFSIQARMQVWRRNRLFDRSYAVSRDRVFIQLQDMQNERNYLLEELQILSNLTGILDFNSLSVRNALKGVCPKHLDETIFGRAAEMGTSFQKMTAWLGFKEEDFKNPYFSAHTHLKRCFRVSHKESITRTVENTNFNIRTNFQNTDSKEKDEGDLSEGEDEYEMDELMAHRMETIMEMETTTNKRRRFEDMKLAYVLSFQIFENWCTDIQARRNNIMEYLSQPLSNKERRQTLQELNRANNEYINELPTLRNKQEFLNLLMQEFKNENLELSQVSEEFLENCGKMRISISDRWAVYFFFVEKARSFTLERIHELEGMIIRTQKELQDIKFLGEMQILQNAMFVGLTTTGAAKYNTLLRMMKSPIVIVEEAAEVMESHIVTSLTNHCRHLILIGDHKQLRPNPNVYKLAKDYNLDISLFERLINNDMTTCQLQIQHRMRPNICKLLVPTIYEDLQNHPSVTEYPEILGVTKSLYFIDHNEKENLDNDSATKSNVHEAKFLIKLCRYLILQGYLASRITIITTYKGQMFLLKKMNSQESLCSGVRITVVDNFQGEENDIILLSLVRSNEKDNIGYLKTDNRICVALSRAKQGFFIIGNMSSMVKSGSATWQKIRAELEKENNIGRQMELKCEVHGEVTLVEKAEDFQKVPEGGCLQMCEKVLPCGHNCPMICHSYDRDHQKYKCQRPCIKICESGHHCEKLCYADCGKCHVMMTKNLSCGHKVKVSCHTCLNDFKCEIPVEKELPCGHKKRLACNVDPEKVKCYVNVEKELPCGHKQNANCFEQVDSIKCKTNLLEKMPKCGHALEIKCFQKDEAEKWVCLHACDILMDCGHTCGGVCHIENDPKHENHVCKKPCGKMCPFDHTCVGNHQCCNSCPKCDTYIERTLPCGHIRLLKCHVDVKSYECRKTCNKRLSCGHKCQKMCKDSCLCTLAVKKKSVDCDHEIELLCHQQATREFCRTKVKANVQSPCGHEVLIPCKMENSAMPEDILRYCKEPCNAILAEGKCEHKCRGNCSSCFQGRIHKRCEEKCNRNLPCGHPCKFPCAALCPPCKEKCEFKCDHSKCYSECGFPCSGCNERCKWSCSHAQCSKRCREKCDRKPCNLPCSLRLKTCGHPCIGLCGELCPPQCRICNAEEVTDIFFGYEDEPDARFLYLDDCKHIIEVKAMDQHMSTSTGGISVKKCPRCTTVIRNCKRYGDILAATRDDILTIKRKIQGSIMDIASKMLEISKILNDSNDLYFVDFRDFLRKNCYTTKIEYSSSGSKRDFRGNKVSPKKVDQYLFESLDNMVSWWTDALKGMKLAQEFKGDHLAFTVNVFKRHENLFVKLTKRLLPLSRQEILDFDREFKKTAAWTTLFRRFAIDNFSSFPGATEKYENAYQYLQSVEYKLFTPSVNELFTEYLTELDKVIRHAVDQWKETEAERRDIFKAVGFGTNHWYKCPKGHLYVIGDCGQPNESSTCPECKSNIGGANHQLASGNTNANMSEAVVIPDIAFLGNRSE